MIVLNLLLLIFVISKDHVRGVSITSEDRNGGKNVEPENEKVDEPENLVANNLSEAELIKLGAQFYFQKKYKESIKCYNKAIEINSSDMTYYHRRALTFLKLSIYDKAIEDFRLLISHNINVEQFLLLALLGAEQTEEASEIMYRMKESKLASLAHRLKQEDKLQEALLCYKELLGRNPKADYYFHDRAKINIKLNNFEDAISDFETVISIYPNDDSYREDLIAALADAGRIDDAIQRARLAGNHGLTYLARHFQSKKKYQECLKCCDEVIQSKDTTKDIAQAHFIRGGCFMEQKQLDEAIGNFREAIAREPENQTYRSNLICALLDAKKVDEAVKEMSRLKTYDLLTISDVFYQVNKVEHGRLCCEEALKRPLEPLISVHQLRGRCERRMGRLQAAITSYELACMEDDRKTNAATLLLEYAEVLLESGEIDAARLVIMNHIKYEGLYSDDLRVRFNEALKKVENEDVKAKTN